MNAVSNWNENVRLITYTRNSCRNHYEYASFLYCVGDILVCNLMSKICVCRKPPYDG